MDGPFLYLTTYFIAVGGGGGGGGGWCSVSSQSPGIWYV